MPSNALLVASEEEILAILRVLQEMEREAMISSSDVPNKGLLGVYSRRKHTLEMGADANAHHKIRGSFDINERGEFLT